VGYSHGRRWSKSDIENSLKEVMQKTNTATLPSRSLMKLITGDTALSNAVKRSGGTKYWAEKLNVDIKQCESKMGYEYECKCSAYLESLGYDSKLTKTRHPYDIIVNGNIKIDVKSSNLFHGKAGNYYTFNLEKTNPTCDIFVCYCINEKDDVQKIYVIPSCVLSGKSQLSIGKETSKYDKYIDNWSLLKKYNQFYNGIKTS